MKTNIIDILSKELVGKKITLLKYNFQISKKTPVEIRLRIDNSQTRYDEKIDRRLTLAGIIVADIINVAGFSDRWEGEYIDIIVEYETHKETLSISVDDVLEINE